MLLSVITACYNSASTIERTFKSVLSQTYMDYEYIVVDGGSTDGTVDIIKQYESFFNGRLRWKSEPDKGIYDAFNKGCIKAMGDYLWIVNSDDFLEPRAFEIISSLSSKSDKTKLPIIAGSMRYIYKKGKSRIVYYTRETTAIAYSISDIGFCHPATLIPKQIYNSIGLYDTRYRIMGDMDWFRRSYQAGCSMLWTREILTNMTEGGVSTKLNLYKLCSDRWLYTTKFYSGFATKIAAFVKWMFIHLKGCLKDYLLTEKKRNLFVQ